MEQEVRRHTRNVFNDLDCRPARAASSTAPSVAAPQVARLLPGLPPAMCQDLCEPDGQGRSGSLAELVPQDRVPGRPALTRRTPRRGARLADLASVRSGGKKLAIAIGDVDGYG
jgi:hypothetical protein